MCLVAQSCPTLYDTMDCSLPGSSGRDSPGKNIGVGCHALLQGIIPKQGSNPGFLHCGQILYHLIHKGSITYKYYCFNKSFMSVYNISYLFSKQYTVHILL